MVILALGECIKSEETTVKAFFGFVKSCLSVPSKGTCQKDVIIPPSGGDMSSFGHHFCRHYYQHTLVYFSIKYPNKNSAGFDKPLFPLDCVHTPFIFNFYSSLGSFTHKLSAIKKFVRDHP